MKYKQANTLRDTFDKTFETRSKKLEKILLLLLLLLLLLPMVVSRRILRLWITLIVLLAVQTDYYHSLIFIINAII